MCNSSKLLRLVTVVLIVGLGSVVCAQQVDKLKIEVGSRTLTFVSLEAGVVKFETVSHKLVDLTIDDQKRIMEFTGWGRVWEDKSGTHHTVADLVEVVENAVVLEKTDGKRIVVPIEKLSKIDQAYAESRRKLSGALPDKFVAKVVAVSDGDTITVLLNRRQYKVRISGIDSPEQGQDFGTKAKKHLGDLVHGKPVSGVRESTDQYGRNICLITIDNTRVDYEMLKQGLAWHYVQYSNDETRAQLEADAKENKRNIWSEPGPIAPWEWRKWGADKRKQWLTKKTQVVKPAVEPARTPTIAAAPVAKPKPRSAMSHWLNTNGNVRHNSGCRWYRNTKQGHMCGASDGRPCGKCGG